MAKKVLIFLYLLFPVLAFAGSGNVVFSYSGTPYSPLFVNSSSCADVSAAFLRWINSGGPATCSSDPMQVGSRLTVSGYGTVVVESISATTVADDLRDIDNRIKTNDQLISALSQTDALYLARISELELQVSNLSKTGENATFDPVTAGQFFAFMFSTTIILWLIAHQAGLIAQAVKNS